MIDSCQQYVTQAKDATLTQGDFGQMQAIDPGDFANWTGRTEDHCETDWTAGPVKGCTHTHIHKL